LVSPGRKEFWLAGKSTGCRIPGTLGTPSDSSKIGEKPIDKTAWIRKRDEMATGQRVDGHVQSFLGHAPLESIGKNWSI
jgi:hypothetical protein